MDPQKKKVRNRRAAILLVLFLCFAVYSKRVEIMCPLASVSVPDGVSLEANVTREGEIAVVNYTVKNASQLTIGLFVGFKHDLESSTTAFSEVDGDRLVLKQVKLMPPQGMFWITTCELPGSYHAVLAPGDSYKGTIRVRPRMRVYEPVRETVMFGTPPFIPVEAKSASEVDEVKLLLGGFVVEPQMPISRPTSGAPFVMVGGASADKQFVLEADAELPEPIEVLDYRKVVWGIFGK